MSKLPRGVRNHNPGNIEKGAPWQGLAEDQSADKRFCVFKGPEWGIRAIARILITYQDKHKIKTVRGIINRWAPPVENETRSYVQHVADCVGVGPREHVDVTRYDVCRPLVETIIRHENGANPDRPDGNWFDRETVNRGLELAGIDVPAEEKAKALDETRPLRKSRTVKGGQVAVGGGAVAAVSGAVAEIGPAMPVLRQIADFVQGQAVTALVIFGVLTVSAAAYMLYARLDDRRQGRR